jgi:SAM-dependent methyltransferase
METKKLKKLNIGSGRIRLAGFINIDRVQIIDGNGDKTIDKIIDIEKEKLPYETNSIDEILIDNTLEHLGDGLIFFLNECWRVLKPEGIMYGNVPPANSNGSLRDITHKRQFVPETFDYLCGQNEANPALPSNPRYSDYGVKPWYKIYLDDGIKFTLRPRKTLEYNKEMENL